MQHREEFRGTGPVDAGRRVIKHQNLGLQQEPFTKQHLLLIAAAQLAEQCPRGRRPEVEDRNDVPKAVRPPASPATPQSIELGQHDVFADGQRRHAAVAQAIRRQHRETRLDRIAGSCVERQGAALNSTTRPSRGQASKKLRQLADPPSTSPATPRISPRAMRTSRREGIRRPGPRL